MISINILNISDFPAIISDNEIIKGKEFLINNNFYIKNFYLNKKKESFKIFNSILENEIDEIILFSSGGFDSVNNIELVTDKLGNSKKFLIGFSDTLHIQSKFHNNKNVYILYGITLRNIFNLNSTSKDVLFNFIKKQEFNINLKENIIVNNTIKGSLYGGHLMIFINIIDIYGIEILKGDILYLEFHGMDDYFIKYYLDILKVKGVFKKISGIILDKDIENYDKEKLLKYFSDIGQINIYSLINIGFLPFYRNIIINKGNLIMKT